MGRALSCDLLHRVTSPVESGVSCRRAAERFGVSASSAIRWRQLAQRHGTPAARPQGGNWRTAKIEEHASFILSATEQDRPDALKRREEWFDGQLDLDSERLVFIDETWASTNMARRHGRCRRGERLRAGVPFGRWKTTTFTAGLRRTGYVTRVLVRELARDDVVIMDNLSSHKTPAVRTAIESVGAKLIFLPP